jgi:hypothetical protein
MIQMWILTIWYVVDVDVEAPRTTAESAPLVDQYRLGFSNIILIITINSKVVYEASSAPFYSGSFGQIKKL